MAPVDSAVARVLDSRPGGAADSDEDEDDLIAELEAEDEDDAAVSALRERRLEQLHAEMSRAKALRETQHGTYVEIKDEKELLSITTSTKLCVVHFMKPDFNRCRVMDEKLRPIAEKHFDTRIVNINVDNAPFLVVKLGIQVLPCVISFIDGIGVDRIIGFEGVGYKPDSFTVFELETRLLNCGVLLRAKMNAQDDARRIKSSAVKADEDDDDDWD